MPFAEILSLIGSIGSAVGGFILKSYHYYRPGILGHDRTLSFASSLIPRAMKRTTANTVRAAEKAIRTVVDLQAQYDAINSKLINNQLYGALQKAESFCRVAAAEAHSIREAARATLATATGKAVATAQIALNTAATALEFYTRHYQEYANAIQQMGGGAEDLEMKAMTPIGISLRQDKIELIALNASPYYLIISITALKQKLPGLELKMRS